jgi:hypothetical protein
MFVNLIEATKNLAARETALDSPVLFRNMDKTKSAFRCSNSIEEVRATAPQTDPL